MNRQTALAALALGDVEALCNVCGKVHVFRALYEPRFTKTISGFSDREYVPHEYLSCMDSRIRSIVNTAQKMWPSLGRACRVASRIRSLAYDVELYAVVASELSYVHLYDATIALQRMARFVHVFAAADTFVDKMNRQSTPLEGAFAAASAFDQSNLFGQDAALLDLNCFDAQWMLMADAETSVAEGATIYARCAKQAIEAVANNVIYAVPIIKQCALDPLVFSMVVSDWLSLRFALFQLNRCVRMLSNIVRLCPDLNHEEM